MYLVYKDWPYREYTKSMDFWLSKNGTYVFTGYSESFEDGWVEIYFNRLVVQYLYPTPLPGTETGFTTGVTTHPGMMGQFDLWGVGEPLVFSKYFIYGFGGEIDTTKDSLPLSNPINGRLDPRMYILFTKAGTVATVEDIAGFTITVNGDPNFDYDANTKTLTYEANSIPAVVSYPEWVTDVVISGSASAGTIIITVSENSGEERTGDIVFTDGSGTLGGNYSFTIVQESNPVNEYLTLNIISGGTIGLYNITNSSDYNRNYEYQINDGGWVTGRTAGSPSYLSVSAGDKVEWRSATIARETAFSGTCIYNVRGNLNSLVDETVYYTFYNNKQGYFRNTNVVDASKLVMAEPPYTATANLVNSIYWSMFRGCSMLVKPPKSIPVCESSYMFEGCTSLTEIPRSLGAVGSYIFKNCSALTSATIPSTTIIFNEDAALGDLLTLTFENCTALQRAEILASGSSQLVPLYIFRGCSNLTYIKCMTETAHQKFDYNLFDSSYPVSGTLVTRTGLVWNDVPAGWTVEYE